MPRSSYEGLHRFLDDEATEARGHELDDVVRERGGPAPEQPRVIRQPSPLGRDLSPEEVQLFSCLLRHAHGHFEDFDDDMMGRLVALVLTFGNFGPKESFHFIANSCSDYVTGHFLSRLADSGVKLKPRHALQLAESGARSKDDITDKVIDLVEHKVLDIRDSKVLRQVVATADGWPISQRVRLARGLGECCGDKVHYVDMLVQFSDGMEDRPQDVAAFLQEMGEEVATFVDLEGDLEELKRTYPDIADFFTAVNEAVALDQEDADDEGNLKDFVVPDGYTSSDADHDGLPSDNDDDDDDDGRDMEEAEEEEEDEWPSKRRGSSGANGGKRGRLLKGEARRAIDDDDDHEEEEMGEEQEDAEEKEDDDDDDDEEEEEVVVVRRGVKRQKESGESSLHVQQASPSSAQSGAMEGEEEGPSVAQHLTSAAPAAASSVKESCAATAQPQQPAVQEKGASAAHKAAAMEKKACDAEASPSPSKKKRKREGQEEEEVVVVEQVGTPVAAAPSSGGEDKVQNGGDDVAIALSGGNPSGDVRRNKKRRRRDKKVNAGNKQTKPLAAPSSPVVNRTTTNDSISSSTAQAGPSRSTGVSSPGAGRTLATLSSLSPNGIPVNRGTMTAKELKRLKKRLKKSRMGEAKNGAVLNGVHVT